MNSFQNAWCIHGITGILLPTFKLGEKRADPSRMVGLQFLLHNVAQCITTCSNSDCVFTCTQGPPGTQHAILTLAVADLEPVTARSQSTGGYWHVDDLRFHHHPDARAARLQEPQLKQQQQQSKLQPGPGTRPPEHSSGQQQQQLARGDARRHHIQDSREMQLDQHGTSQSPAALALVSEAPIASTSQLHVPASTQHTDLESKRYAAERHAALMRAAAEHEQAHES